MSKWIEVTDKDCIDLSDDRTEINILYSADKFGSNYVTVKTEDVLLKIKEWKDNAQDSAPNPEKAD
jgi:hypothetical protein